MNIKVVLSFTTQGIISRPINQSNIVRYLHILQGILLKWQGVDIYPLNFIFTSCTVLELCKIIQLFNGHLLSCTKSFWPKQIILASKETCQVAERNFVCAKAITFLPFHLCRKFNIFSFNIQCQSDDLSKVSFPLHLHF